jgi:3-methyladenine DNA glycosylase AlkC
MARGPDGMGGGAGFSLADQLFNAETLGALAREHAGLPGFDAERFHAEALAGMAGRGVMARLDWIADCLEAQLPRDFPAMAEALQACMPPPLDPQRSDGDFGRFIHAVPGTLAARHGLAQHPERALDLLHAATKRFSMEFAIRPFLDRWPDLVLARLALWAEDPHYHVRRLVSEGTRPRLPWGRNIALPPEAPLPLLDRLHADPTRFVTRSVANHLNDLSRLRPEAVLARLRAWREAGRQAPKEIEWITRHALRTAVKRGERGALDLLGYAAKPVRARLVGLPARLRIGDVLPLQVEIEAETRLPVMVDYRLRFARPGGAAEKVFKLRTGVLSPGGVLRLEKRHPLKAEASTYRLHPGRHGVTVMVNGQDVAEGQFDLLPRG